MNLDVYNSLGEKIKKIKMADNVNNFKIKKRVVYDSYVVEYERQRQGSHKVKDKSEVRGGGKKPWRQKGTGRARHGSIRSPIWRGGGVTFGPQPNKNYRRKINKKNKKIAIKSIIKNRIENKRIFIIDKFNFTKPETKKMKNFLLKFQTKNKKILIVDIKKNDNLFFSIRNIKNAEYNLYNNLSLTSLIKSENIVFNVNSFKKIEEMF